MVVGCKQPSRSRKLHHCRYDQSLESSFPTSTKLTNNTLSHLQPRKEKPPNLTSTTKINNTPYGLQSPRHEPERTSPIQLHECAHSPTRLRNCPHPQASCVANREASYPPQPTHPPHSNKSQTTKTANPTAAAATPPLPRPAPPSHPQTRSSDTATRRMCFPLIDGTSRWLRAAGVRDA